MHPLNHPRAHGPACVQPGGRQVAVSPAVAPLFPAALPFSRPIERGGVLVAAGKDGRSRRKGGKPTSGGGSGAKRGIISSSTAFPPSPPPLPPAASPHVTGPIQSELLEELTPTEFAEAPKWGTWCNHVGGEWVGVYSAFTPWAADPEPVWMDERGKYIYTVLTRSLEERGEGLVGEAGQAEDVLLRKLGRAISPSALQELVMHATRGGAAPVGLSSSSGSSGGGASGVPDEGEEDEEEGPLEVEALTFNTQGVVVFDGGHYSAGPDYIGPPTFKMLQEDEGSEAEAEEGVERAVGEEEGAATTRPAPTTTSVVESCLVDLATRSRVRLKLTLRIGHCQGNDEVDVQVLRVLLFREQWAGPEGLTGPADIAAALGRLSGVDAPRPAAQPGAVALSQSPADRLAAAASGRPARGFGSSSRNAGAAQPEGVGPAVETALRDPLLLPWGRPGDWQGRWSVFTVTATSIEDTDMMTGEPLVTWVYTTNEDLQLWAVEAPDAEADGGGALWLPGGVVATFKMVDLSAPSSEEDEEGGVTAEEDAGTPPARGLRLGLSWALPVGGQVLSVYRDYDGGGLLRGVQLSTAVKGGWSGGQM